MKKALRKIKQTYDLGDYFLHNDYHVEGAQKTLREKEKSPTRTEIINYLLGSLKKETNYLEIGVRYTESNFDHILANYKVSVDPGVENEINPVDFKMTSDVFFANLKAGKILDPSLRFDLIFIDGLHLADQVERDIRNSLDFLNPGGFIVLHDCNPPTEYHAREDYAYHLSPAKGYWNGTTWKAFYSFGQKATHYCCCIDTDWGVGIISDKVDLGRPKPVKNDFFEFRVFEENRADSLNLMSFDELKSKFD